MKTLTLILALTFSVMFSSTSSAEWSKVGESVSGDTFYVDFERIRKHDGYVFFWVLTDRIRPKHGDFSHKMYWNGDCKLFRFKVLSSIGLNEPMGGGTGKMNNIPDKEWSYHTPESSGEMILKSVCSR